MYYKLRFEQESWLLRQPETGMGYQVIEASKAGSYLKERFLILNSSIAIDMDSRQAEFVRKTIVEGITSVRMLTDTFGFNIGRVLSEREFRNVVNEKKASDEK